MCMHKNTGHAVPTTWLLLDSQSMVDLIAKPKMLVNIRPVRDEDSMRVHCNSSSKLINQVGELPGYGTVCYKPTSIVNAILVSRVASKYQVEFNSKCAKKFRMMIPNSEILLQLIPNGRYYFDATDRESNVLLINKVA